MAESPECRVWDSVTSLTEEAQRKGTHPLLWATQLSSYLKSVGMALPSTELADVLVSYICWDNNVPITWKFLDKALALNIVPPLLVLALLSTRVIPARSFHPAAYRLYLELLNRHAFTLKSQINEPNYHKVMKLIDDVLQLFQVFGLQTSEAGTIVVEFIFSVMWQLLDASLDDEGLLELTPEKKSRWATKSQDMEIDGHDEKQNEHYVELQNLNTVMAIELIGKLLQNEVTSRILYLARQNMPTHWVGFTQRLQILGANSSALSNSKVITSEVLLHLTSDSHLVLSQECKTRSLQKFNVVMAFGSLSSSAYLCHGTNCSVLWLALDLVLEDAIDFVQINAAGAIGPITGLTKVLKAINQTTWHDTFLGLWIAALRLVRRERGATDVPVAGLDACLCMLLSGTTRVVADLIEEEKCESIDETECDFSNNKRVPGTRHNDLVSSLRMLGDYQGLLTPPESVVSAANHAAAKAMLYISDIHVGSPNLECINMKDMPINCSGNMRHLIVEACIARNLLDTSAYFWPGYVNGSINQLPKSVSAQVPGWSSFMNGAPLTPLMIDALVSSPASSLAELEKIYEIAITGSDDDKISAATILCGASLTRGWNIQEQAVYYILKLLSPPVPADYSGSDSHLIGYALMLNVIIISITYAECYQNKIFSLHGLVPQLACSLLPICEVFGSCLPNVSWTLPTGEKITAYAVFANAFTLLHHLWMVNYPAHEHRLTDLSPVGYQLSPDYLLLVRNSHVVSSRDIHKDQNRKRLSAIACSSSLDPIFIDSFPKLKVWYRQHQACVASTLSGLVPGSPVHQIVDGLLDMIFRKINRERQSLSSASSGNRSSPKPEKEDTSSKPMSPAWDILEAIPFVLDATLTACDQGRITPREFITGLKDLTEFLPVSMATIVSYLSAEAYRGVWKSVPMNGTDWPSPTPFMPLVEEKVKIFIASTGVDIPGTASGGSFPAYSLPLPLAAFISLSITYKIDGASRRFLRLTGPTVESLVVGCPWPFAPMLASLWTRKAKHWSNFISLFAARCVFFQSRDTMVQLLKSCFTATLGLNATPISSNGGVGALLGHVNISNSCDAISPVAPGIFYLRIYRAIRNIDFLTEHIVSLLMHSVREISCHGLPRERLEKLKMIKNGMIFGQVSLSAAMTQVKLVASLGASLVWLSGGLCLVHLLIKETLPCWFISTNSSKQEEGSKGMDARLGGYALAYFAVLCGAFAWGIDSSSAASKERPQFLGTHLDFMASALNGKISLGCNWATWRAYVSGFVSLMVGCAPAWVQEVDVDVLKRLSRGLRQWNEGELSLALLSLGGVGTMGVAAELIIEKDS